MHFHHKNLRSNGNNPLRSNWMEDLHLNSTNSYSIWIENSVICLLLYGHVLTSVATARIMSQSIRTVRINRCVTQRTAATSIYNRLSIRRVRNIDRTIDTIGKTNTRTGWCQWNCRWSKSFQQAANQWFAFCTCAIQMNVHEYGKQIQLKSKFETHIFRHFHFVTLFCLGLMNKVK